MKTRIFSFFLALVMLFSCLSLTVFAAEASGAEATAEEEAELFHSDDEIKKAIKEVNFFKTHSVFKDKYTFNSSPNKNPTSTSENPSGKITVEETKDGGYRYVYGKPTSDTVANKNAYVNAGEHYDYSGRNLLSKYDGYTAKGQSFVAQISIEFTDGIFGFKDDDGDGVTSGPFMKTAAYLGNGGYNNSTNRLGTVEAELLYLSVTKDPRKITLIAKDSTLGSKNNTEEVATLEVGVNYNIAVHVDPSVVNADKNIYGVYNVYINGECVAEEFGFLTPYLNNTTMNLSEATPYFLNSAFSSSEDGCDQFVVTENTTAYFFTDNKADNYTYKYTLGDDGKYTTSRTDGADGKLDEFQVDDNGNGIPDVYENIEEQTKDASGKKTSKVVELTPEQAQMIKSKAIGTVSGADDYCLSFVRFFQTTAFNLEETGFYFDNIIVYYTEGLDTEYVDVTKHNYEVTEHTHDYNTAKAQATYKCPCEDSYTITEAFDTNGDRVCDFCISVGDKNCPQHAWEHVHNRAENKATYTCAKCDKTETIAMFTNYSALTGTGNLMTPEELNAKSITSIISSDLDTGAISAISIRTNKYTGADGNQYASEPKIKLETDESTGNQYFRYYNPTYAENYTGTQERGTSYLQMTYSTTGYGGVLSQFWNVKGKNITYSFDFLYSDGFLDMYDEDDNKYLIDIMSYMFGSTSSTTGDLIMTTGSVYPIHVNGNGVLNRNGQDGKDTTYQLTKDNWYNILIYQDVKNNTFDIFVNGECIWNDVQALGNSYVNALKWTYTEGQTIREKTATGTVVKAEYINAFLSGITETNDEDKKTYTVKPEDFFPQLIRTPQLAGSTVKTLLGYDNFKIYRSETNIECTHKCTASNVCDLCGETLKVNNACDACGYYLADGVSVLNRNVTLGDKIGMNLYLTLSESVRNTEGAAVVVSVDGKQTLQLPVKELTPEADGTYKVTALLRSIDMTKDVTVEVTGIKSLGTYTTSVYEYLKALDKKSTNATEKALIVAMKNYGAYAQKYFAEKNNTETGVLANLDLLTYEKSVDTTANPAANYAITADYKYAENYEGEKITINGAALILSNETRMKFFFSAGENATVTVGGAQAKIYRDEVYGDNYVIVSRATPTDLDETFTIVIEDKDESGNTATVSITVSILSAIDAIFKYETDANYLNLAGAIYNYYAAAEAYAEN